MKRFEDENIRLVKFNDFIDVVCPNCNQKAAVKIKNELESCPNCGKHNCESKRVFECKHCYYTLSRKKIVYEPYAKVYCSSCTEKYEVKGVQTTKQVSEIKVKCPHCNHSETVKAKLKEIEFEFKFDIEGVRDPFYNCSLWYQQEFKQNVFWALNNDHINYLERYIVADLRERNSKWNGGQTLVARLPKFVKEAKNRDKLLKIIEKWKQK
ncbi:hypothetical protein FLACOL_00123 [Flavobacterium columnare]|uniref:Replication restart DNA helicase PriA n=2 Tax=Flavobacterium TaxID=237 RepID=A0ABW8PQU0_9FLAO|nr:hypothetical protein [Flavobacterium columnare]SPE76145.1 hypothetical protein FLACOL_00123 [Flavobacterium columnare]